MKFHTIPWLCLGAALLLQSCVSPQPHLNQLTRSEQREGWRLLFDGQSLDGWRNYKEAEAPKEGWIVENGCLKLVQDSRPGDLVTVEKFDDFELIWEWRISPGGNNGIKYLVSEERGAPGPEYQMIDDSTQKSVKHQTASLYDILPPASDKRLNPPGEWNHSRVIVLGKNVEHWLNGKKVLAYELETSELQAAIAESKFQKETTFGRKISGHIMLTDHKDEVWYRNMKIRSRQAHLFAEIE
ncbi:MAG: DUF1080 domain-containing protein [Verrucomicrobia bacterium]|nr:DUF1080 domain-containing protein [Verrucomicrobiota bacterium]